MITQPTTAVARMRAGRRKNFLIMVCLLTAWGPPGAASYRAGAAEPFRCPGRAGVARCGSMRMGAYIWADQRAPSTPCGFDIGGCRVEHSRVPLRRGIGTPQCELAERLCLPEPAFDEIDRNVFTIDADGFADALDEDQPAVLIQAAAVARVKPAIDIGLGLDAPPSGIAGKQ